MARKPSKCSVMGLHRLTLVAFCLFRSALQALLTASEGGAESAVPADSCMQFKAVPGSPLENYYEITRSGSTVTSIKFTSANTLTPQTVTLLIQF